MSISTSSYCGCIWHHGIKGQKWGIRRTPEELGHRPQGTDGVEKSPKHVKIIDGVYHSEKGFMADQRKFKEYCLRPGTQHAKQFFDIGYKQSDSERLFRDIEKGYDAEKKFDVSSQKQYHERYSIPMRLGVTGTRMFRTVWQKDGKDSEARFVTAYIDRRLKED